MMELKNRIHYYLELSKAGIVTLVIISVLAGYLGGHSFESPFEWGRFFMTLFGIFFLSSASSALNQLQERKEDLRMPRTATRPLATGKITPLEATVFIVLGFILGGWILAHLSLELFWLGVLAVISYNGLYTMWWKKRWSFAAIPGAIPGALPILMGYVASSRNLWAPQGWYFFFLLFFWQMPHFWSLSIRYREDYAQGGFPTLSVSHGDEVTRIHILFWCLAYVGIALSSTLFLKTHWINFSITLLMSIVIIRELLRFINHPEAPKAWLKFFLWINLSLIVYLASNVADLYSVYIIAWFA
jgi:protoheme IX farnesyltransferase